ncbi:nicotinate-nucleotide--dimethylbenzimidazole phosphoribosyltransferase [Brevundimonas sp.]|uniref:nicotinate-nucleotide--dimethylbenzimidazole phosphoribosyltransferase n=3 Tax=Brevundimonas sp. TaxID=1871086 RepID=UPI002FCC7935
MSKLDSLLAIPVLDRSNQPRIQAAVDGKAKPPRALGRIEELAVQLAVIQKKSLPSVRQPQLLVFAGDHGLTRSGVAAFPSGVTVSMVDTLLAGRASANAFARVVGARVSVIDAGVAADLSDRRGLIHAKIAMGTQDASKAPAMSTDQVISGLLAGADIATQAIGDGADLICLGEMGIGNSSSAALVIHRLAPAPLEICVGPGAGHSPEGLAHKHMVLAKAAARTDAAEPLEVLTQFGGYEIAMMAGALLASAKAGVAVVVDGVICSAAALIALRLAPQALDYCIFAHASVEPGHRVIMEALEAKPLLDLDMRVGEGTGTLLAIPLLQAACALLSDVADLKDVLEAAS